MLLLLLRSIHQWFYIAEVRPVPVLKLSNASPELILLVV